jgi:hypothetical protein
MRLHELVTDLLGPLHWRPGDAGYGSELCGLDKRKLLEDEILPQMVTGPLYVYRKEVSPVRDCLLLRVSRYVMH